MDVEILKENSIVEIAKWCVNCKYWHGVHFDAPCKGANAHHNCPSFILAENLTMVWYADGHSELTKTIA